MLWAVVYYKQARTSERGTEEKKGPREAARGSREGLTRRRSLWSVVLFDHDSVIAGCTGLVVLLSDGVCVSFLVVVVCLVGWRF